MALNVGSAVKKTASDLLHLITHTSFSWTKRVSNHCRTFFAGDGTLFLEKAWATPDKPDSS